MRCYIISYDLRKQRNYQGLYDAIQAYGTWAKITESTWAIVTGQTASQVHQNLLKQLDSDDGLIVIKSGGEATWERVICKDEWLKQNLVRI